MNKKIKAIFGYDELILNLTDFSGKEHDYISKICDEYLFQPEGYEVNLITTPVNPVDDFYFEDVRTDAGIAVSENDVTSDASYLAQIINEFSESNNIEKIYFTQDLDELPRAFC